MPANPASQQPELAALSGAKELARRIEAQLNLQRLANEEQAAEQSGDPLHDLRSRQWVNSHLPIGWPHMPKGLLPKLIALLQKITRRLLRWYIAPLVAQQNEFNEAAVAALQDVYRHIEREVAASRSEREDLALGMRRLIAVQSSQMAPPHSGEPPASEATIPMGLLSIPASPSLAATRHDALLQRLLLAQQLQPARALLPLLIVAADGEALADRARELGLAAYTLDECLQQQTPSSGSPPDDHESLAAHLAARAPESLAGIIWTGGLWRHTPAACLQLFGAARRALAAHAPLLVESIVTTDASAVNRYIWADPWAVRPYAGSLVSDMLRAADFREVAALEPSVEADGATAWFAVIGYRDNE